MLHIDSKVHVWQQQLIEIMAMIQILFLFLRKTNLQADLDLTTMKKYISYCR